MNLKRLFKILDNKSTTFFDKDGNPSWYIDKDKASVFSLEGHPIGYLYQDTLFSHKGEHIGFFKDGWIIDLEGRYLLFTEVSVNGPIKPQPRILTLRSIQSQNPIPQVRQFKRALPVLRSEWSNQNIKNYK